MYHLISRMVITLEFFLWCWVMWDLNQSCFCKCDGNSPYVQQASCCQENGRTLIAPQGEWTGWVFWSHLCEWQWLFLFCLCKPHFNTKCLWKCCARFCCPLSDPDVWNLHICTQKENELCLQRCIRQPFRKSCWGISIPAKWV